MTCCAYSCTQYGLDYFRTLKKFFLAPFRITKCVRQVYLVLYPHTIRHWGASVPESKATETWCWPLRPPHPPCTLMTRSFSNNRVSFIVQPYDLSCLFVRHFTVSKSNTPIAWLHFGHGCLGTQWVLLDLHLLFIVTFLVSNFCLRCLRLHCCNRVYTMFRDRTNRTFDADWISN
jgi:hypothetical protein